ncbi:helix-turn-helix domain-containing protein [Tropicibacter alexandrii]|uniref:helix-turn-helix domain-containing protein n=1 Tax=Tropicibacter alexandrii TaxID=2267683 RepID=UPI000EF48C48|nr:XRE family transcriptional regulator [Tropicibacter alexandrii]
MKHPFEQTAAAVYLRDRITALSHRKTQAEIAAEAGFANANMMSLLKAGKTKIPLDRIPSLARALECDPAWLMRLALEQVVGKTSAQAIGDIFGTPVTANERAWLEELRDASDNSDPRLTGRTRTALRAIFNK